MCPPREVHTRRLLDAPHCDAAAGDPARRHALAARATDRGRVGVGERIGRDRQRRARRAGLRTGRQVTNERRGRRRRRARARREPTHPPSRPRSLDAREAAQLPGRDHSFGVAFCPASLRPASPPARRRRGGRHRQPPRSPPRQAARPGRRAEALDPHRLRRSRLGLRRSRGRGSLRRRRPRSLRPRLRRGLHAIRFGGGVLILGSAADTPPARDGFPRDGCPPSPPRSSIRARRRRAPALQHDRSVGAKVRVTARLSVACGRSAEAELRDVADAPGGQGADRPTRSPTAPGSTIVLAEMA